MSMVTGSEARNNQVVMFSLVELMTHLVIIALILGLALRKEADIRYQQTGTKLIDAEQKLAAYQQNCGDDPQACQPRAKKGQGRPPCQAGNPALVSLRGLADGDIQVIPLGNVPPAMAGNPAVKAFRQAGTVSLPQFRQLVADLDRLAKRGQITGTACAFRAKFCFDHSGVALISKQIGAAQVGFYGIGYKHC